MKTKTAIIVVDVLNDFVTGALQCDRAKQIVSPLQKLIAYARRQGIYVIYSNDAHIKGVDKELEFWGDHALIGSAGAEVVPEITPRSGDFVVPKRRYSGFFQTDLHLLLEELQVKNLIITGLHTHMCVRHTVADAFYWGYNIIVPQDCTDAFTKEEYLYGLQYLKATYGAIITDSETIEKSYATVDSLEALKVDVKYCCHNEKAPHSLKNE